MIEHQIIEIKKTEDKLECIYCSQTGIQYKNKTLCQECKVNLQTFQKEINFTVTGGLVGMVISGLVLHQISGSVFSFGAMFGTIVRTIYQIL